jgi:hypothetical protein
MKFRIGGAPVMSMETRWLHQDHAQALRELREHRRRCIQCGRAIRKRDEKPCDEGEALKYAEQELQRQAREADAADCAPNPDQEPLFDLPAPDPGRSR